MTEDVRVSSITMTSHFAFLFPTGSETPGSDKWAHPAPVSRGFLLDATSHLGLLLLSFPCTDWGPEPLICTPCVDSASAGSASPASFFFFFPLPLWLQTCTSDQHLIKHTQVCLKSNLEQISQDGPNTVDMTKVNTHSAHARRHACTHTHTRSCVHCE